MTEVTHIISCGGACRSTHQLRRHFNFGLALPFDWWAVECRGILAAIDPASDPYEAENLEAQTRDGRIWAITSRDRSIRFQHDFPRGSPPEYPVIPNWRAYVYPARERFMRRRARLLALNAPENVLLFVRHGRDSESNLRGIIDGIAPYFPKARIQFLFVNTGATVLHPAVESLEFPETDGADWRGNPHEWSAAFATLNISLVNAHMPPFKGSDDIMELQYAAP